jgi:L-fuconolactonase
MGIPVIRIDAHHHLWRYRAEDYGWIEGNPVLARDFSAADLEVELASAGVDAAISVQARQSVQETADLLAIAQDCPAIVGVVGWADLRDPAIEAWLDKHQAPALLGFRHVVQDEADDHFLRGEAFRHGVRAVVSRGLTYDLLINHAQMGDVPAFLDAVGPGRFVLDHCAKPDIARGAWQPWADHLSAIARHDNVWCKISGLVTEADHAHWQPQDIERYLAHCLEAFGPQRLIWGSDWPVCLLAASYAQVAGLVADFVARHCPQAEADIFGGNALRAYALEGRL